jgi:cell division septum initiation protein DivIVA
MPVPLKADENQTEAYEVQNSLLEDLDQARNDIAAFLPELMKDPQVLEEVALFVRNFDNIPERPWLRNALSAELDEITAAQKAEQAKHSGGDLSAVQQIIKRLAGKLAEWVIGSSNPPPGTKNEDLQYAPVYDSEILDELRFALDDDHDGEIQEPEPEGVNGPIFKSEMHKVIQYFYLLIESSKNRRRAEAAENTDITEEAMVANRLQYYACIKALRAILEKYELPNRNPSSPSLFTVRKCYFPVQRVLANNRATRERLTIEARRYEDRVGNFDRTAGERG